MRLGVMKTDGWTGGLRQKWYGWRRLGAAVTLLTVGGLSAGVQAADPSAAEIARRSAAVDRISAWKATVEIIDASNNQIQRKRQGEIGTRVQSGADTQRYYRFSAPQDIRGTSLLIHEHPSAQDDIWLFLPSLGKPRRIAGSAKKNSFVGTQYTFADLTSFEHERYRHSVAGTDACGDRSCWVLESTPADEGYARDIGYSKQRAWVQKDIYRIVRIEYYDPAGALIKTQTLGEFAEAGADKALALARTMVNHRNGQSTSIRMSGADFKPAHDDADFSAQRLGGE